MFRKIALGLVGAAALGAMALSPSVASAGWKGGGFGFGFGHHGHHFGHGHGFGFNTVYLGGGYDGGGCYETRRVRTPYGFRWRTVNVCY